MPATGKQRDLHSELTNIGFRAQATTMGLVQLCAELRRANLIDGSAVGRIKAAITDELTANAPRTSVREDSRRSVRARLDRVFAGEEEVGTADVHSLATEQK